jgi:hypothetical protein
MESMTRYLGAVAILFAFAVAGCSDAPPPKAKEPEKPAEPITGREAFYKVYGSARLWAPDVQGLRVASIAINEVKGTPGKSGAWEVTFVSPSKAKTRSFTYSVVEVGGNLHKGVFASLEENYSGSGQAKPWPIAALKIDSDAAYETAVAKSGDAVKKIGESSMFYLLEQTSRFPDLAWRIVWGESVTTSKYSVFVDASTGEFLEKVR